MDSTYLTFWVILDLSSSSMNLFLSAPPGVCGTKHIASATPFPFLLLLLISGQCFVSNSIYSSFSSTLYQSVFPVSLLNLLLILVHAPVLLRLPSPSAAFLNILWYPVRAFSKTFSLHSKLKPMADRLSMNLAVISSNVLLPHAVDVCFHLLSTSARNWLRDLKKVKKAYQNRFLM